MKIPISVARLRRICRCGMALVDLGVAPQRREGDIAPAGCSRASILDASVPNVTTTSMVANVANLHQPRVRNDLHSMADLVDALRAVSGFLHRRKVARRACVPLCFVRASWSTSPSTNCQNEKNKT